MCLFFDFWQLSEFKLLSHVILGIYLLTVLCLLQNLLPWGNLSWSLRIFGIFQHQSLYLVWSFPMVKWFWDVRLDSTRKLEWLCIVLQYQRGAMGQMYWRIHGVPRLPLQPIQLLFIKYILVGGIVRPIGHQGGCSSCSIRFLNVRFGITLELISFGTLVYWVRLEDLPTVRHILPIKVHKLRIPVSAGRKRCPETKLWPLEPFDSLRQSTSPLRLIHLAAKRPRSRTYPFHTRSSIGKLRPHLCEVIVWYFIKNSVCLMNANSISIPCCNDCIALVFVHVGVDGAILWLHRWLLVVWYLSCKLKFISSVSVICFQFVDNFGLRNFNIGLVAGFGSVDVWQDGAISAFGAAVIDWSGLHWALNTVVYFGVVFISLPLWAFKLWFVLFALELTHVCQVESARILQFLTKCWLQLLMRPMICQVFTRLSGTILLRLATRSIVDVIDWLVYSHCLFHIIHLLAPPNHFIKVNVICSIVIQLAPSSSQCFSS